MKVIAVACEVCGKNVAVKNLKVLPFKQEPKKLQKVWWGCEDCRAKLQKEMDKENG